MTDDLTKLSGPELSDRLDRLIAAYKRVYISNEEPAECITNWKCHPSKLQAWVEGTNIE